MSRYFYVCLACSSVFSSIINSQFVKLVVVEVLDFVKEFMFELCFPRRAD